MAPQENGSWSLTTTAATTPAPPPARGPEDRPSTTSWIKAADEIQPYVLLTNGHDGCAALRMIPTSVRVVCWNTLTLALSKSTAAEGITIFHYGELADRMRMMSLHGLSHDAWNRYSGGASWDYRIVEAVPNSRIRFEVIAGPAPSARSM